MKKKKGLIILVALLAVFIGLYFVVDSGILEPKPDTDGTQQDIPEVDLTITSWTAPAVRVVLENPDGTYTFDKMTSAGWFCEEYKNYPLNPTRLDEMAAILGGMKGTRRLAKNDDNMELFGLNTPEIKVSFASPTGLSHILTVGNQNQATTDYYVYLEGSEYIYMMASSYIDYFKGDIISYVIVPEFPEILIGDVIRAQLKSEKADFTATRLTGANEGHEALMTAINSMYVSSVVDPYTEDLAKYGLDTPYIEVTLNYEHMEGGYSTGEKAFTLKVGAKDPTDDRYSYATISDYPNTVYRLFYMSLERLEQAEALLAK